MANRPVDPTKVEEWLKGERTKGLDKEPDNAIGFGRYDKGLRLLFRDETDLAGKHYRLIDSSPADLVDALSKQYHQRYVQHDNSLSLAEIQKVVKALKNVGIDWRSF